MARSSSSRLVRLRRILENPFITPSPCDRCKASSRCCRFIADFSIMSCDKCTRMGRPCVTSSIDRLDAVAEDLALKIQSDEKEAESLMGDVESLLWRVAEVRKRLASNRKAQEENNQRVNKEVWHLVENLPPEDEGPALLGAAELSVDLDHAGIEDPFSWPASTRIASS